MIIRKVMLHNYGVYAGKHTFDLSPRSQDSFNRPIVLLQGKNGAGKTTLFRAIRLALHGSLALGPRVTQVDYDSHLAAYISQVPENVGSQPEFAGITIEFDFVKMGKKAVYQVERTWKKAGEKIIKEIKIFENGAELDQLDEREKEEFLRDLIAPGVVDIFFFDGEKMKILAEGVKDKALLGSTLRALFGLDLVHRLQQDIDIYMTRKEDNNGQGILQEKLKQLSDSVSQKESERDEIEQTIRKITERIAELETEIGVQGQELAGLGGSFADRVTDMHAEKQRLQLEIENCRRDAIEQCGGLMPFAIAGNLCRSLAETLVQEERLQDQQAASAVLEEKLSDSVEPMLLEDFWHGAGVSLDETARQTVVEHLTGHLQKSLLSGNGQQAPPVTHHLSKLDRTKLLKWIDRALGEAPRQFDDTIGRLNKLEKELKDVDHQLSLVPAEEVIVPLIKKLNDLNQELGALQQQDARLNEDSQRINNSLEIYERQLINVRAEIAGLETTDQRVRLAARSQVVLQSYEKELLAAKLKILETSLHKRFNTLCRKEDLVNGVRISPDTFEITLIRHKMGFSRSQLSAGENQVLAIALMWALRDISGIPIPIIIDTPLSRLDIDHRSKMVEHYFPHASHQVILLATDAEVQQELIDDLYPHISHTYLLEYDDVQNKTDILELTLETL